MLTFPRPICRRLKAKVLVRELIEWTNNGHPGGNNRGAGAIGLQESPMEFVDQYVLVGERYDTRLLEVLCSGKSTVLAL